MRVHMRNFWPQAITVACGALALGHMMPPLPSGTLQNIVSALQTADWSSFTSDLLFGMREKMRTMKHDDIMEMFTTFWVIVLCYLISCVLVIPTFGQLALVPFYELLGVEPYQLSDLYASIWAAYSRLTGERSLVVPICYVEDPDAQCSICFEQSGKVARVCGCSFAVHLACLEEWRLVGKSRRCTLCKDDYMLSRPPAANCVVAVSRILGLVLGIWTMWAFIAFAHWLIPAHISMPDQVNVVA